MLQWISRQTSSRAETTARGWTDRVSVTLVVLPRRSVSHRKQPSDCPDCPDCPASAARRTPDAVLPTAVCRLPSAITHLTSPRETQSVSSQREHLQRSCSTTGVSKHQRGPAAAVRLPTRHTKVDQPTVICNLQRWGSGGAARVPSRTRSTSSCTSSSARGAALLSPVALPRPPGRRVGPVERRCA